MQTAINTIDAMGAIGHPDRRATERPENEAKVQIDAEWPAGYPRTSFDLATQFMNAPDQIQVDNLIRHVLLNPEDRPVYEPERQDLQPIVREYGKILAPLFLVYRQSQSREMITLIESGSIRPAAIPRPSELEIRRFANAVADTPEEAEAYYAEFLRNPPVGSMLGASHIEHKGEVYLLNQFHSLPVSDRMHADIQFVAIEYLATVCAWFESRRLANSASISSILSSASKFSQSARRAADTGRRKRSR